MVKWGEKMSLKFLLFLFLLIIIGIVIYYSLYTPNADNILKVKEYISDNGWS